MALCVKLHQYYAGWKARKEEGRQQCLKSVENLNEERRQGIKKLEELRGTESGLTEEAGALNARIRMFDEIEDRFNQEYAAGAQSGFGQKYMEGAQGTESASAMEGEKSLQAGHSGGAWSRNLLGEYEAGALEIRQAEYEKELTAAEAGRRSARKDIEQYREQIKAARRLAEDRQAEKSRLESAGKESGRVLADYDKELAERSVILRYVSLGQEDAFDTEKLLAAVHRKLLDADMARQSLEKEADALEKEYRRLAQGQVLELS